MIRTGPIPAARAASTNSRSRTDRTCARIGRTTYGTAPIVITKTGIRTEPPEISTGPRSSPPTVSAAPRATPSRIPGKAQSTSTPPEIAPSTKPPAYPDSSPSPTPSAIVMSAAATPINSEFRPP